MKKVNRTFVRSIVFAGTLTLAAVVGTGAAEAAGHQSEKAIAAQSAKGSHGNVQAKDEKFEKPAKVTVKIQKPVKAEKPVKSVKAAKPVKAEKPAKDKTHSQAAEHASETAKKHAAPNAAVHAVPTKTDEPVAKPVTEEPTEVVIPVEEEKTEVIEIEVPVTTNPEEGKKKIQ